MRTRRWFPAVTRTYALCHRPPPRARLVDRHGGCLATTLIEQMSRLGARSAVTATPVETRRARSPRNLFARLGDRETLASLVAADPSIARPDEVEALVGAVRLATEPARYARTRRELSARAPTSVRKDCAAFGGLEGNCRCR